MKQKNISKILKISAFIFAIMMLFSACGGNLENESKQEQVVSGAETEEIVSDDGNTPTNSTVTDTSSQGKTNTTDNKGNTSSGGKGNSVVQASSTVFAKDYLGSIPDSVKKKEIHVVLWRDFDPTEKKVVEAFKKKTGIKIRLTKTTESEYLTKVISLVTGNDPADVFVMGSTSFPASAIKVAMPLDKKTFRLDDPIWFREYMNAYRVGDNYFGVAIKGSFSCEDTMSATYYRPSVLKSCGISAMPYDLYKQGKWTWAKELEYARAVKNANPSIVPISLQQKDIYMYAAGTGFVSYDGKQFVNNLNTMTAKSTLVDAWRQYCTINQEKLTENYLQYDKFVQGKVGLMSGIIYGMTNEGWFADSSSSIKKEISVVPIASKTGKETYVPARPKIWAVSKSADNAEGAAFFLRYFLDPANSDLDGFFLNSQCREVYDLITSPKTKRGIDYSGVIDYVNKWTYYDVVEAVSATTTNNVYTELESKKGSIDNGVNRANKELKRLW